MRSFENGPFLVNAAAQTRRILLDDLEDVVDMVWQIPIIGHLREHGQDFPSDLRNLSDFHLIPLHHMFKIYGHYDIILQLKK